MISSGLVDVDLKVVWGTVRVKSGSKVREFWKGGNRKETKRPSGLAATEKVNVV